MNKAEAYKLIRNAKKRRDSYLDCIKGDAYLDCVIREEQLIEELQAIIDAPEPKTGWVLGVDDLRVGDKYFTFTNQQRVLEVDFKGHNYDKAKIVCGLAFHDDKSCEQYLERLMLEQELRVAQIADGGVPVTKIINLTNK